MGNYYYYIIHIMLLYNPYFTDKKTHVISYWLSKHQTEKCTLPCDYQFSITPIF